MRRTREVYRVESLAVETSQSYIMLSGEILCEEGLEKDLTEEVLNILRGSQGSPKGQAQVGERTEDLLAEVDFSSMTEVEAPSECREALTALSFQGADRCVGVADYHQAGFAASTPTKASQTPI